MGGALARGWVANGRGRSVVVVDPAIAAKLKRELRDGGARVNPRKAELEALTPSVVILAVKPQSMAEVAPRYARFAASATFVSIAAGASIATLRGYLGDAAAVVRAMPNLPAVVGAGVTAMVAGPGVTTDETRRAALALAPSGEIVHVADEALIDPITAVSGSGPAYVFLLVEALAEAGVAAGLAPELAMRLARATVIGSGTLLAASSAGAADLRRDVTSPGGTTAAALEILTGESGLAPLMARAVQAAAARAKALGR